MALTGTAVDLGALIGLHETSPETKSAVAHNVEILKCIRGGLRLAEQHRLAFDPREEYWHLPERRLAVAYLADRWSGRFAPAIAVRSMALDVLRHMERARIDGVISYKGVDYNEVGGIEKLCDVLAGHVRRLGPLPAWERLRKYWPKLGETAADDIIEFLQQVATTDQWERGFKRRFPWFGYLAAVSEEELRRRQSFFYGYANIWTTTNAYVRAGAQSMAPVIQNTQSDSMLGPVLEWAKGRSPLDTRFPTLGRDDEEPQDRCEHSTIVEVYGFLNLQRAPFYNNRAEVYREWFGVPASASAYELTAAVGAVTTQWLDSHPEAVVRLAALFGDAISQKLTTRVELETIESPKLRKLATEESGALLDTQLLVDLEAAAKADLAELSERDLAAIALHLLLDSKLYLASLPRPEPPPRPQPPVPRPPDGGLPIREEAAALEVRSLPDGLRPYGERALAYLKAGLHVLFAGAPGTGKTTLAQFVGYAWDRGLSTLPEQMPADSAPLTTVGNSAWSPFHTVGGLMPNERGTFTSHAGIFIDPDSAGADPWRLRNGAIVLDEMNRADLDRCIGELYPLLSGSVNRVSPAGLPGVRSIVASPTFRVLATVNDANLDDIVFPISEGLARRFQRIELQGGSRPDVLAYLGLDGPDELDERQAATLDALASFFEIARDHGLLVKAEDDDRLPFGVAYFALLRAWVDGRLDAPVRESTTKEQARDLLAGSLRTLGRTKRWEEALRAFLAKA